MRDKLTRALSLYLSKEEEAEARRPIPPNPSRPALLLQRLDEALAEHAQGASLARALYDNFNDRLLTALERAAGLPVTYGGGRSDKGRPS